MSESENSSNEGASSLVSRAISQAAAEGEDRLYLSDTSIFSLGDSITISKGTAVEESNSISSKTDTYLELSASLSNDHENGAFIQISSSLDASTIVSENSVVTDTLVVGDPDQSGEENVFSIEDGNVSAEGNVSIQGDLDVQGSITIQGEDAGGTLSPDISSTLSDIQARINRIEEGIEEGHGQGTNPYVSPNYAIDPTSPCPNTGYYLRVDECTNCYFEENLNQIGALAKQLVEFEFDYVTGEAAVRSELYTISGSLSGRLGEMNVLLNQSFCFTGCDGNPFPRLGKEEGDILQQLYMRDYNTKQAQKIMRGLYDETSISSVVQNEAEWTELSEGDTTIRRSPGSSASSASNRIALSKDFKALSEDADRKIKQLVYNYNMYGAQPRQVAGEDGVYKMIVQSKKDY